MDWKIVLAFFLGCLTHLSVNIPNKSESYHKGFLDGIKFVNKNNN